MGIIIYETITDFAHTLCTISIYRLSPRQASTCGVFSSPLISPIHLLNGPLKSAATRLHKRFTSANLWFSPPCCGINDTPYRSRRHPRQARVPRLENIINNCQFGLIAPVQPVILLECTKNGPLMESLLSCPLISLADERSKKPLTILLDAREAKVILISLSMKLWNQYHHHWEWWL